MRKFITFCILLTANYHISAVNIKSPDIYKFSNHKF
ncbi:hypothetical protein SAMN05421846_104224 [Chryseobacterium taeanense]|uniref:Uncharacterized protein n=1 Tax=Chryseobacterium taeanense TaxID=311334 RepID=A0A1G8I5V3_9FLAO|nr:hypothetical protein SAMN05421846_104224 [Chryseobacterium taeanense]